MSADDRADLECGYSENILFAAQALTSNFRVRDIEQFTTILSCSASTLCSALEALRFVFHDTLAHHGTDYHMTQLHRVMQDFDKAWCHFEWRLCHCFQMFSLRRATDSNYDLQGTDLLDNTSDLMQETLEISMRRDLFTQEEINTADTKLIIAVPRLSIIVGLLDPRKAFDDDENFARFQVFENADAIQKIY